MVVHLLRHTKPEIEEGICYGQSDIGLAETYKDELQKIRHFLSELNFDVIYSSPLYRCMVIAQSLCTAEKVVIYDKRLKELNFGEWELNKWDDIAKKQYTKKWFDDFVNVACPGGESYRDLIKRTKEFINDIKLNNAFDDLLIVTHAGIIRAFQCIINQVPVEDSFSIRISYGEITTLNI